MTRVRSFSPTDCNPGHSGVPSDEYLNDPVNPVPYNWPVLAPPLLSTTYMWEVVLDPGDDLVVVSPKLPCECISGIGGVVDPWSEVLLGRLMEELDEEWCEWVTYHPVREAVKSKLCAVPSLDSVSYSEV